MSMFREDNNLRKGKDDWKKILESRQSREGLLTENVDKTVVPTPKATPITVKKTSTAKEDNPIEAEPLEESDSETLDEMGTSTGAIAVVPSRLGEESSDMEIEPRMDERTKKKFDNLMSKYDKMQEQLRELEEEMNFLKEMGEKQYVLDEMKLQMGELKEEIDGLKTGKGKKSQTEEVEDEESEEVEDEESEEVEDEEELDEEIKTIGSAKNGIKAIDQNHKWTSQSAKKKEDIKMSDIKARAPKAGVYEEKEEKIEETFKRNRLGKVEGAAKTIDLVDVQNKKKRLVEGSYQRYLQTRKSAKDSGETPNDFSFIIG